MMGMDKVLWTEGILLSQQHFQCWDDFYNKEQRFRFSTLSPDCWGISRLEIVESALAQGEFILETVEAVMPNGHIVEYHRRMDEPMALQIKASSDQRIKIYLSLPFNQSATGISGYPTGEYLCAWKADYKHINDIYDQKRVREVGVGRLRPQLLQSGDLLDYHQYMQIAELEKIADKQYQLVRDYIPPTFFINTVPILTDQLKAIIELLRQKADEVAKIQKQQDNYKDYIYLLALRRSLSMCWHYYHSGKSHPKELYQGLYTILANLQDDIDYTEDLQYMHEDLRTVFHKLFERLQRVIMARKITPADTVMLKQVSEVLHISSQLEIHADNHFYIAVQGQAENAQWPEIFAKQIKIDSRERVTDLIASATSGVDIKRVTQHIAGLPAQPNTVYFYLIPDIQKWEYIKQSRNIALYIPREYKHFNINLICIKSTR